MENNENKYCVYCHIFPNGKKYVGQTSTKPEYRWGVDGKHYQGQPVYKAIEKYGWDNIEHRILFDNLNKESADRIEKICIFLFKTTIWDYGYNIQPGGCDGGGFKRSQETKDKISKIKKELYKDPTRTPMYGRTLSHESRKKISDALKGKYVGEKASFYGKHLSEEHKEKLKLANTEHKSGDKSYTARAVICLEMCKMWTYIDAAAQELDKSLDDISSCVHGRSNTAADMHWMFVEDFSFEQAKNVLMKKDRDRNTPVMCIETGDIYDTKSQAEKMTGIVSNNIASCVKGRAKTAGGYHWKDAEQEWLAQRSEWAEAVINSILSNKELMNQINLYKSKISKKER